MLKENLFLVRVGGKWLLELHVKFLSFSGTLKTEFCRFQQKKPAGHETGANHVFIKTNTMSEAPQSALHISRKHEIYRKT